MQNIGIVGRQIKWFGRYCATTKAQANQNVFVAQKKQLITIHLLHRAITKTFNYTFEFWVSEGRNIRKANEGTNCALVFVLSAMY